MLSGWCIGADAPTGLPASASSSTRKPITLRGSCLEKVILKMRPLTNVPLPPPFNLPVVGSATALPLPVSAMNTVLGWSGSKAVSSTLMNWNTLCSLDQFSSAVCGASSVLPSAIARGTGMYRPRQRSPLEMSP